MKNQDKRFERFMQDARFNQIVKLVESLFYSDSRITYDDVLDAAFVARVRYVEMNPATTLVTDPQGPREGE